MGRKNLEAFWIHFDAFFWKHFDAFFLEAFWRVFFWKGFWRVFFLEAFWLQMTKMDVVLNTFWKRYDYKMTTKWLHFGSDWTRNHCILNTVWKRWKRNEYILEALEAHFFTSECSSKSLQKYAVVVQQNALNKSCFAHVTLWCAFLLRPLYGRQHMMVTFHFF